MDDLLEGTTPGPWHVERWTDENDQPIWDDDTNDYVFCVCHPDTVCDASTVANVSHEANARLIAKAPELAARVKVLTEALQAVPIPDRLEAMSDFYERMDAWLKGPYRDALTPPQENDHG